MSKRTIIGLTGLTLLLAAGMLLAQPDRMGRRRPGGPFGPSGGQSMENQPPKANSPVEQKILDVLDNLDRNQRRGNMNVPVTDGRLLRLLAESIDAHHIVEIGTSNGYSGIWQALALKATGGKLTTFEIDPDRAALARENFKRAGVDDIITLIEGDAHEKVGQVEGPVDMVFIDADKEGYLDYLNKLLPKVRPGGLILAHNTTNAGPQMQDYLKAVTTDPDLETVFIHNDAQGIGVTLKKR